MGQSAEASQPLPRPNHGPRRRSPDDLGSHRGRVGAIVRQDSMSRQRNRAWFSWGRRLRENGTWIFRTLVTSAVARTRCTAGPSRHGYPIRAAWGFFSAGLVRACLAASRRRNLRARRHLVNRGAGLGRALAANLMLAISCRRSSPPPKGHGPTRTATTSALPRRGRLTDLPSGSRICRVRIPLARPSHDRSPSERTAP